ncbi:hypothetical protein G0U57_012343 [Chelydra serpentina]|uniref:Uncharacterized protein n=1 Tax=Chelydra serpentina TaxID=8475 RepID=A0A8T1T4U9_CHESE|nr:hypothetical protein G0U57_012343 [Chelydra serpentina]
MLMEKVEDKQWILKVKSVMTGKHTETGGQSEKIKLYDSSFHCLKPRSWISDEVIDGYFRCVVEKADGKSKNLQNYILLLPHHTPGHWVLAIALIKKKELLITDPLCDEMKYERTCLKNWRSFIRYLLLQCTVTFFFREYNATIVRLVSSC